MWTRTGQPYYMLQTMTDEELEQLVSLGDSDSFREEMRVFMSHYYDSRKASVDFEPIADEEPDADS